MLVRCNITVSESSDSPWSVIDLQCVKGRGVFYILLTTSPVLRVPAYLPLFWHVSSSFFLPSVFGPEPLSQDIYIYDNLKTTFTWIWEALRKPWCVWRWWRWEAGRRGRSAAAPPSGGRGDMSDLSFSWGRGFPTVYLKMTLKEVMVSVTVLYVSEGNKEVFSARCQRRSASRHCTITVFSSTSSGG